MSIELKQAARQALDALVKSKNALEVPWFSHLTTPIDYAIEDIEIAIEALRTAIQQAEAKTDDPVAWLDEMLVDTKEVFDANGTETPQVVRDVIEYVASWITVYNERRHPTPGVPDGHVLVPLQVLHDASDALGNFIMDHGWGDSDMQAMDNLDAYIARHTSAQAQKGQP